VFILYTKHIVSMRQNTTRWFYKWMICRHSRESLYPQVNTLSLQQVNKERAIVFVLHCGKMFSKRREKRVTLLSKHVT
jgi:hypothetical protein